MSESSNTREIVEPDESRQPTEARNEMDNLIELILEADDRTPEEAGYGHGV